MNAEERLKKMMDAARVEHDTTATEWNAFARRAHRSLYARRAATVAGAVALIVVGAVATIVLTSNPVNETPIPPATSSPEPSPTPEEPSAIEIEPAEQEIWLVDEERLWQGTTVSGGELAPGIAAEDEPIAQRAAFWLAKLLEGPASPDLEIGAATAIPEGTELLGVRQRGDALQVDLSSEFESGGGSLSMQLRVGQIVYTATQFPGIDRVFFMIDGEEVDAIGGEGLVVADGLTRRDFQEGYIAPNVVVESPKPGDEFPSNGGIIRGFANVFEANVSWRIVDENGDVLDEGFTTATCGSGCWGDFEISGPSLEIDDRQEGRIEVLTFSAEDGSEQDVVSIPVTLVPMGRL